MHRVSLFVGSILSAIALAVGGTAAPAVADGPPSVDFSAFIDTIDPTTETWADVGETGSMSFGAHRSDGSSTLTAIRYVLDWSHVDATVKFSVDDNNYCATGTTRSTCDFPTSNGDIFTGMSYTVAKSASPGLAGYATVTVSSPNDPHSGNNTARIYFDLVKGHFTTMSLKTSTSAAALGKIATATITIHNSGPNTDPDWVLDNFTAIDPGGVIAQPSPGCSLSHGSFTCDLPSIHVGDTRVLHLRYKIMKCSGFKTILPYESVSFSGVSAYALNGIGAASFTFHPTTGCPPSPATVPGAGSTRDSSTAPPLSTPATSQPAAAAAPSQTATTSDSAPATVIDSVSPSMRARADSRRTSSSGVIVAVTVGVVLVAGLVSAGVAARRRGERAI